MALSKQKECMLLWLMYVLLAWFYLLETKQILMRVPIRANRIGASSSSLVSQQVYN